MEVAADHPDSSHFITYSMVESDIDFTVGRSTITKGVVASNLVLLQGPTSSRRQAIYHRPFDFFRVYLPQTLLAECHVAAFGRPPTGDLDLFGPSFCSDPVIQALTQSLVHVDAFGAGLGPAFVDAVGLALGARLLKLHDAARPMAGLRTVSPLAKWRLNRVTEFIEDHLGEPIYLAQLSAVAGLSRMHFAAQFRAAVGCAPHTYIVQRRIALSKRLLLDHPQAISDVAHAAGFASNAQFSNLFRRAVGMTPSQWRAAMFDRMAERRIVYPAS